MVPALLIVLSVFLISTKAQQEQCLPELGKTAETKFEADDVSFDPCTEDDLETSPLVLAAADAIFSQGTVIPENCTVTVMDVKCDSKEICRRGRGRGGGRGGKKGRGRGKTGSGCRRGTGTNQDTETMFDVEVELTVKINCSSDSCIRNSTDADDRTAIIAATDALNALFPSRRIDGTTFEFNGTTFTMKNRDTEFSRGVCAICNGTVVDDNLIISAATDPTDVTPTEATAGTGSRGRRPMSPRRVMSPRQRRPMSGSRAEDLDVPLCSK